MTENRAPHILILNAAEGLLQLLIARKETAGPASGLVLLCAQSWHAPSQGAELLALALQQALERLKLTPSDIGGIACVRGPGSFTGVRLVLATAAGLARATGARLAGLDYMRLLAANAQSLLHRCLRSSHSIWVVTHARRQLVHMQGFACSEGLKELCAIQVCSPFEAVGIVKAAQEKAERAGTAILLGSGLCRNLPAFEEAFADEEAQPLLLPAAYSHPGCEALLLAASEAEYLEEDISPLYVRPSDAEENLESIAASLGLDPHEAREKLERLTGRH